MHVRTLLQMPMCAYGVMRGGGGTPGIKYNRLWPEGTNTGLHSRQAISDSVYNWPCQGWHLSVKAGHHR